MDVRRGLLPYQLSLVYRRAKLLQSEAKKTHKGKWERESEGEQFLMQLAIN